MIPIDTRTIPQNNEELRTSLLGGLRSVLTLPQGEPITMHGSYPNLQSLEIVLHGAEVPVGVRPNNPIGTGQIVPGFEVGTLKIVANPLRFQGAGFNIEMGARNVSFGFDRAGNGALVLVPSKASGQLRTEVAQADLETLLLAGARMAAEQQNATIEGTELTLNSTGARSLEARVRVRLARRVAFVTARGTINIHAQIDLDDQLVATVSRLTCTGEGVVGNMIAPFVNNAIQRYVGYRIPLAALPLGNIAFSDLQMQVSGQRLIVIACFQS